MILTFYYNHLSSSGQSCCMLGWAAAKAGSLLSLASSLVMVGNCDMSTLNLFALYTCN